MSLRKFWFKIFDNFEKGDLVRPSKEYFYYKENIDEFWVWDFKRAKVLVKIPYSKFVGRVVKISGDYLFVRWCADKRNFPLNDCYYWQKEFSEIV